MPAINPYMEKLEPVIRSLPGKPGVYQYYDKEGKILYIGKARNLRKRVASYFNRDNEASGKLRVLVKKIAEIRFLVVDTETDALLLENNLIKQYQPRYNVLLKDDKSFPWICIKKEHFPRVFSTRNFIRDGSEYFGPYTSVKMMNTLLDLIRQLFPLRTCKYNLSPENIRKKKYKRCLEYHLGKCLGPCEGLQTEEDYQESIRQIRDILKGNIHTVIRVLHERMNGYAENLEFEKAQIVKEKLELLERFQSKSTVVSPRIRNVDVASVYSDSETGYVNYLRVVDGAIVQSHTVEMKKKLDEPDEELLLHALIDLRTRLGSTANEVVVPFVPGQEVEGIRFTVPARGDKKQLLDLSERNVRYYRLERMKQQELVDPDRHVNRIMARMKEDLRMPVEPRHIECFDNSNFQGDYPVAAMVCFKNGKPDKKSYRHFNIRTVKGPNDFASMEEVIYRRYKRLLDEKADLPQLIVVDGGKGQLSSAVKSLERLGLRGKITILGIAKRLEELYFPDDPHPLYLDKKSETLRVIQQLRDEAHRFGITHHRKRLEKGTVKTVLTNIPGIGYRIAQKLLWHFKSVKKISQATKEEIAGVIGPSKAEVVYEWFRNEAEKKA
ncbi:MAG: excinuclease ABC subunit UvrC [Bacteroidales bacterium]